MKERWIVLVRDYAEYVTPYGIYHSLASAQRKADAVNRQLEVLQNEDGHCYAYAVRLGWNITADRMASTALGEPKP